MTGLLLPCWTALWGLTSRPPAIGLPNMLLVYERSVCPMAEGLPGKGATELPSSSVLCDRIVRTLGAMGILGEWKLLLDQDEMRSGGGQSGGRDLGGGVLGIRELLCMVAIWGELQGPSGMLPCRRESWSGLLLCR